MDRKGGNESNRVFDRIWTISIIGGILARSGVLRKRKKPKYKVPKEGTPEFEKAVKQGEFEAKMSIIALVVTVLHFLWGSIKSIGMTLFTMLKLSN